MGLKCSLNMHGRRVATRHKEQSGTCCKSLRRDITENLYHDCSNSMLHRHDISNVTRCI